MLVLKIIFLSIIFPLVGLGKPRTRSIKVVFPPPVVPTIPIY